MILPTILALAVTNTPLAEQQVELKLPPNAEAARKVGGEYLQILDKFLGERGQFQYTSTIGDIERAGRFERSALFYNPLYVDATIRPMIYNRLVLLEKDFTKKDDKITFGMHVHFELGGQTFKRKNEANCYSHVPKTRVDYIATGYSGEATLFGNRNVNTSLVRYKRSEFVIDYRYNLNGADQELQYIEIGSKDPCIEKLTYGESVVYRDGVRQENIEQSERVTKVDGFVVIYVACSPSEAEALAVLLERYFEWCGSDVKLMLSSER